MALAFTECDQYHRLRFRLIAVGQDNRASGSAGIADYSAVIFSGGRHADVKLRYIRSRGLFSRIGDNSISGIDDAAASGE